MMGCASRIGVVIVAYQSANVICECLESLFISEGPELRVVVVDNNSSDGTCDVIREWASGIAIFEHRGDSPTGSSRTVLKPIVITESSTAEALPSQARLTVLRSPFNGGYAYGVNQGLRLLLADLNLSLFWVLNPDCVIHPSAPQAIVQASRDAEFSLLGGRTAFYDRPNEIQTDGGVVSRLTARCSSLNAGLPVSHTPMPKASSLDFISGANLIASRQFLTSAGPMDQDYFLYYEEVAWAFRRQSLPLRVDSNIIVYHHGGTSIGSGDLRRRPTAFSNYFNYRSRMRFARRFMPLITPIAFFHGMAKGLQLLVIGSFDEGMATIAGTCGIRPSRDIRNRLSDPKTKEYAFGEKV